MHFPCHFMSIFMVTWSQNEPSQGRKKSTQLKSTLTTETTWLCFFMASGLNLTQLTINDLWEGKETIKRCYLLKKKKS